MITGIEQSNSVSAQASTLITHVTVEDGQTDLSHAPVGKTVVAKTSFKTTEMKSVAKWETRPVISTDPDNRLTRGTDEGLYVSDSLNPDPLAYYILAKA